MAQQDPEFVAIGKIIKTLEALEPAGKARVVAYLRDRYPASPAFTFSGTTANVSSTSR